MSSFDDQFFWARNYRPNEELAELRDIKQLLKAILEQLMMMRGCDPYEATDQKRV